MLKISLLTLLTFACVLNCNAQFRKLEKRKHAVNKLLFEIIADIDFKNAEIGFFAIDSKSGRVISAYNADKTMIPASNQKLITTATVLELYGPDYQFCTKLEYSGYIDTLKHILYGDIIIKGGGDPSLGSVHFESTKNAQFMDVWTESIRKLGIDSIAGAVIANPEIYASTFTPITWSWNNLGNYFGAGACGLSIYDNYFTVYFNTSDKVGDTAQITRIVPDIPNLRFVNKVVGDTINYDNTNIYGAPNSYLKYLIGSLPINKINFGVKGVMPDPAYFAAFELKKNLENIGIGIRDSAKTTLLTNFLSKDSNPSAKTFCEVFSPSLAEILKKTNTYSINLFAEHLLNHIGLKISGNSTPEVAASNMLEFWESKGIDTQGMYLYDGSGLSRYNSFTPRQMVKILSYMKDSCNYFGDFYNSLPIGGQTGTLKNMFKDYKRASEIKAKSGTVNRAKAYSGYITSLSGREIIFSIIINDFSGSSYNATKKLEKLMIALADFNK